MNFNWNYKNLYFIAETSSVDIWSSSLEENSFTGGLIKDGKWVQRWSKEGRKSGKRGRVKKDGKVGKGKSKEGWKSG